MPNSPSDPEKYTINEIMDRLKSASSTSQGEGELVTRADGTQALRVKKRKRRTEQPLKKAAIRNLKIRIAQVSGALILLCSTAILLGGAIVYANSSPFRNGIIKDAEKASGATVQVQQFRMNPKSANAAEIYAKWSTGNVLQSLRLTEVTAAISPSSFLGKSLKGEEVNVKSAELILGLPKLPNSSSPLRPSDFPLPIQFNHYRVPQLNVSLGDAGAHSIKITKSQASLHTSNVNKLPQISLYQGKIEINGWPSLRLDRSLITLQGSEINIINLRILEELDDRGAFELSGSINPHQTDELSKLSVSLESFKIAGIVGPDIGRLFSGRIDSTLLTKSNLLTFSSMASSAPELTIGFKTSPSSLIEFQGLPFLFALSHILEDAWFERPAFETKATGMIYRKNGIVELQDLDLMCKDRMAIKGKISLNQDQSLSGKLEIGVAESMIFSSKTSRLKAMFNKVENGYCWATLTISGTGASPIDNFKELYIATAEEAKKEIPSSASSVPSFDDLTRPK